MNQRNECFALWHGRTARFLALSLMCPQAADAGTAQTLDLAAHRGNIVQLDFWASWCGPCRQSLQWLNEMQSKYADRGLVLIGINVDRERAEAERFLREVPATFPVLYDPLGQLAAKYELMGLPTSIIIGTAGAVVARHVGFLKATREEREAELQRLLKPAAAPGANAGTSGRE
jgi:thiol-disulfide isomerase/thioredoxin